MLRKVGCSWLGAYRQILRSAHTLTPKFDICWKCGHHRSNVSDLFCDKCKIIQRPHEKDNFFKVFKLPIKYSVDLAGLQQAYRAMQTQLHPDKFANKSKDEKAISAEFSSLVNHAYNTLTNPMARAMHMLHLHRETIMESDKATNPEFLMKIMELNEAVEAAKTERELRRLDKENRATLAQIVSELEQKFSGSDIWGAKQLVIKMKYYHSLGTKIREAQAIKGIVD